MRTRVPLLATFVYMAFSELATLFLRVHIDRVERGKILHHPHELIELRRIGRSASGSIISIFVYSGGLDGIIYSLFGTAFGSNDLCLKHP